MGEETVRQYPYAVVLPIMASSGHYQVKPLRNGRKEPIVEPAMVVAVVTAVIGAVGTVLAAWVQSRAQRGSGGNAPASAEQAVPCLPGDRVDTAPGRDLPPGDRQ